MTIKPIAVISEDAVTQALLHKCISHYLPARKIVRTEVKNGRGNVQREIPSYIALSSVMPVVLGVDLDQDRCAPSLLNSWGVKPTQAPQLLLRVAVREAESWLLADRQRLAKYIGAKTDDITKDPDSLVDPKIEFLSHVYRTSTPELRGRLLPRNFGKHPRIGPS